jgi:hypothetical protein
LVFVALSWFCAGVSFVAPPMLAPLPRENKWRYFYVVRVPSGGDAHALRMGRFQVVGDSDRQSGPLPQWWAVWP